MRLGPRKEGQAEVQYGAFQTVEEIFEAKEHGSQAQEVEFATGGAQPVADLAQAGRLDQQAKRYGVPPWSHEPAGRIPIWGGITGVGQISS